MSTSYSLSLLATIAEEFDVPVRIIDTVTEILSWANVYPNIFWEEGLECICLEWECPVGYLTINVYANRIALFKNLKGIRKNEFDATLTEAIEAYNDSHDILAQYVRTFEIDEVDDYADNF